MSEQEEPKLAPETNHIYAIVRDGQKTKAAGNIMKMLDKGWNITFSATTNNAVHYILERPDATR